MPTGTYRKELVDWLRSLYGPDRAYKTARRLSLAAGRNQNAVATVEERGHATAEVIADLARAAGVSPLEAFHHAGWLTEEEISSRNDGSYHRGGSGPSPDVSGDQARPSRCSCSRIARSMGNESG